MAKELCLTPGGPVSEVETECDKKHNDRESAEAIVTGSTNREGPNVVTMQITVSKSRTARKLTEMPGRRNVTGAAGRRTCDSSKLYKQKEKQQVELIERILDDNSGFKYKPAF